LRVSVDRVSPRHSLWIAFSAVVLSFLAATAYSEYRASAIDDAAHEIVGSVAPAIRHLAAARTEGRHLQRLLRAYTDLGRPSDREEIGRVRGELASQLGAYLILPGGPALAAVRQTLAREAQGIDELVDRVLVQVDRGEVRSATRLVSEQAVPALERTNQGALRALELSTARAGDLGRRIERLRVHAARLAFGLDVAAIGFAVLAAWIALRVSRKYTTLLERQRDEFEAFSGRVAHDILSPLTTTGLALQHAARKLASEPASEKLLGRGQRSLDRVRLIVDGLLAFARAGARPRAGEQVALAPAIRGVLDEVQPAADAAGVALVEGPVPACAVACSPGVFGSLLSNLVRNAVKYGSAGPGARVTVRGEKSGGVLRLEVEDTGPGLSTALHESVFQPYFRATTTSQPGIGLGLATVKRLAEAHGGRVGIHSQEGQGATFWFELPLAT
jgi:signal transduction histidine kinase